MDQLASRFNSKASMQETWFIVAGQCGVRPGSRRCGYRSGRAQAVSKALEANKKHDLLQKKALFEAVDLSKR